MGGIRTLLAVFMFSISCFLLYDLFANGFSFKVLFGVVVFYAAAYLLLPDANSKQRSLDILEMMELVVKLPFRIIVGAVRGIKSGDSGDGFDL